jgi:serine/threonine-protein kinase
MAPFTKCPNIDQLQKLKTGPLEEEEARLLEEHVESCPSCFQLVLNWQEGDLKLPDSSEGEAQVPLDEHVEALIQQIQGAGGPQDTVYTERQPAAKQPEGDRGSPLPHRPLSGIAEVCERFTEAWNQGAHPRIEDYLSEVAEWARSQLLREMLLIDLERRCKRGDRPLSDEYEGRFPHEAAIVRAAFLDAGLLPLERIGPYKVCRRLGRGGFGQVYLCYEEVAQRYVAIKLPRSDKLASSDARQLFLRELLNDTRLRHEGIVPLHDIVEADGLFYLVYGYIDGLNLAERLRKGPLPAAQAVQIIARVADALHYAHGEKVYHRDIKPANILLDREEKPYLTDFGLAIREEELPRERGRLLGTVAYMAPEIVSGKGDWIDGRTDVYSLGVVLYELLCRQVPFRGPDAFNQILDRDPVPPRQVNAEVPSELERICLKAMAKRIDARYRTAGDMAKELRAALARPPWLNSRLKWAVALLFFALMAAGWLVWCWKQWTPSQTNTVAVLLQPSNGDDSDLQFLSQGITESLIHSLSQSRSLTVRPFTSVASYYTKDSRDVGQAGRDLRVQVLIRGRVSKQDDNIIVSVELIDVDQMKLLWGDSYPRKLGDLLKIKEDITRDIARHLRANITGEEQQRINKRFTRNSRAYQLYLLGRYHTNKRSEQEIRKGLDYFDRAIQEDHNYALAYAGLADGYSLLVTYAGQSPEEYYPKARTAASAALKLDDTLAEAYTSLANILTEYEWDWPEAEAKYLHALELNPNYVTAHHWYSRFLSWMARHEEAIREAKAAQDLDPLSVVVSNNLSLVFFHAGQYDQAKEQAKHTLEMDSKYFLAHAMLGWAYQAEARTIINADLRKKKYEDALSEFEEALGLGAPPSLYIGDKGIIYALLGDRRKALEVLTKLEQIVANHQYIEATSIASLLTVLGENDKALDLLEKAFENRDSSLVMLKIDRTWDNLRSHPRFVALVKKMNFP